MWSVVVSFRLALVVRVLGYSACPGPSPPLQIRIWDVLKFFGDSLVLWAHPVVVTYRTDSFDTNHWATTSHCNELYSFYNRRTLSTFWIYSYWTYYFYPFIYTYDIIIWNLFTENKRLLHVMGISAGHEVCLHCLNVFTGLIVRPSTVRAVTTRGSLKLTEYDRSRLIAMRRCCKLWDKRAIHSLL